MNVEHAGRKFFANRVCSDTMYILMGFFLTSLLITHPLWSFAAVFNVKDEYQMKTALDTASRNNEADIINILSD